MENGRAVDQNRHRALRLIASQPALFRRQGSVAASWREYRGRKLGPYYRLAYRHGGRQCSVYLGRAGKLVEQVRAALRRLQGPLSRLRTLARFRARIKASLRREKLRLDGHLRRFGLYLKGFETRGRLRLVGRVAPPALPTVSLGDLTNPRFTRRML